MKQIEDAVRAILVAVGEDPDREGLQKTPHRVAKMYTQELLRGYQAPTEDFFTVFNDNDYRDLIISEGIPFYSLCEHHLLPFFGRVHIAYVPSGKVLGLSKLARIVGWYSQRQIGRAHV